MAPSSHHFALRLDPNGSQQEIRVRITTYRGDPKSSGFPKRTITLTQTPVSRAGFHMGASVSESVSLSWVFWGNQKEKHFGRVQLQRQPRFLEPQDTILQFHTTPCADFQRGFCAKHGARGKAGTSMFSGNEGTPINYPLWFSFSPTSWVVPEPGLVGFCLVFVWGFPRSTRLQGGLCFPAMAPGPDHQCSRLASLVLHGSKGCPCHESHRA